MTQNANCSPIIPPLPDIFGEPEPVKPIPDTPESRRFCPVSLHDWINLCQKADVPCIPAVQVASFNRSDLLNADDPHRRQVVEQALNDANQQAGPGEMLRFDYCASEATKFLLATGQADDNEQNRCLYLEDSRAVDIAYEFPREAIPVWKRPWTAASILDGYPVEYRVYVEHGKLLGISNYYPQRPLPHDPEHIAAVTTFTNLLIAAAATPFLWNQGPGYASFIEHGADSVSFTADFLVDAHNCLLFLEGGPPHPLGAHPCCFKPFDTNGLALTDRNAS